MTVKLSTLLSQYLYAHHRLDIPGIGTFFLDPSSVTAPDNHKQKTFVLTGVTFESNPAATASPDLIAFISTHTGKMKALASSDLESFIELAQQFLNIGKPYTFDGIGTLIKGKDGHYDFVPDTVSTDKLKNQLTTVTKANEETENAEKYESFLSAPKQNSGIRKPVLILLIVCGLGLAVWGGYIISQRSNNTTETSISETTAVPQEETLPLSTPDTNARRDGLQPQPADTTRITAQPATGEYKYVLEIADSQRAFKRYNQLRTNLWDVHLETKDSVRYKLFMKLPVTYGDTTHILDSLKIWTGKRVYIEHSNGE